MVLLTPMALLSMTKEKLLIRILSLLYNLAASRLRVTSMAITQEVKYWLSQFSVIYKQQLGKIPQEAFG